MDTIPKQQSLFDDLDLWMGEDWKLNIPSKIRRVQLAELSDYYGFQYRKRHSALRSSLDPDFEPLLVNIVVRMGTNQVLANFDDVLYYKAHGRRVVDVLDVDCTDQQAFTLRLHEIRRFHNTDTSRALAAIFREVGDTAHDYTEKEWADRLEMEESSISKVRALVEDDLWQQVCDDEITIWTAYKEQKKRDTARLEHTAQLELASQPGPSDTEAVLDHVIGGCTFVHGDIARRHPAGFFDWIRGAAQYLEKVEHAHGVPSLRAMRRKNRKRRPQRTGDESGASPAESQ